MIGYWLSDDKEDKLNFRQFAKYCSQRGVDVVRTEFRDPDVNGVNNGCCQHHFCFSPGVSLFIHKLNDLVVDAEAGEDSAIEQLAWFERWISYHPEIDVIDPLPNTRVLLNRFSMSKMIEKTCSTLDKSVFFIPPFCELATPADVDDNGLRTLLKSGLQFPIICKPIMAESHDIVVITCEEGLQYAPVPCLAQTFISHFQLLFKLYILGDRLFCVDRPSLPDPSDLVGMGPVLRFNTAALGKGPPASYDPDRTKVFFTDPKLGMCNGVPNHDIKVKPKSNSVENTFADTSKYRPSPTTLQILATALRSELNLELFGADVIVDAATGRLACVDINAFPGYKGVPDLFSELFSFLTKRARKEITYKSQMPTFIS